MLGDLGRPSYDLELGGILASVKARLLWGTSCSR